MALQQQIRAVLAKYWPKCMPFAYRCLHATRLGPYALPYSTREDLPGFVEMLRRAITARNEDADGAVRSQNPHLLLYTHGLSSGGAERQWCYLAVELARRGYAVTMLVNTLDGEYGHYLPLLRGSRVRVLALDMFLIPESLAARVPSLGIPLPVYQCMAAFAQLRPSHVLCQLDGGNIYGGAAVQLLSGGPEKTLFSFRNVNPSHFPHFYQPWMFTLYKVLAESRHIVLSGNSQFGNADHADWLGIPRKRIATIHNALHIPEAVPGCREAARREFGLEQDDLALVSVFRLAPEKNPLLMVRVVRRLRERYPQLTVLHAGVGVLEERVRREAERQGLGGVIRFLGRRQDVLSLMRAADMFLLTSDFEGLPNVLLEAQAVGLPVVSTRVGGVPEAVVEGETALLAGKGEEEELFRHCCALLDDAALRKRVGEAGRAFVLKHFSHKALGDRTLDALGLPREQPDLQPAFAQLPGKGMRACDAYHMSLFTGYIATLTEPVAVFAGDAAWEQYLPTPERSVCVLPRRNQYAGAGPAVIFDWMNASSWNPLQGVISRYRTAVFGSDACLDADFRFALHRFGVRHIIFCNEGKLYRIPALHPPLYKRVPLALRYVLRDA